MSNKNYTRYSKMNGEEPMVVDEIANEVRTESAIDKNESVFIEQTVEERILVEPAAPVTEDPIVEPEPTPEPKITKIGRVCGCKKLNVRNMPNRDAKILAEVAEGSEVMIDDNGSTATFYKVCTECGIDGYCMKQYIKVLS